MKALPLLEVAPLAGERVGAFTGERRFLSTGGLKNEAITFDPVTFDNRPSRADLCVLEGDILVARMKATNKVLLIDEDLSDIIVSTGFAVLRPNRDVICPEYLLHFLRGDVFQIKKDGFCAGATQQAITNDGFSYLRVPVPSLTEQRRIAAILDKADAIRRKRQQAIDLANSLSGSLFLDMFGDPEKNEKHWQRESFGSLGELDRGRSKHRPRNAPELYGGGYPFIQTGDVANCQGYIKKHQQTYSELGLQQSRLWKAGTLCITIAANIAKTGILTFDACFPDSIVGFTPGGKVTTEYIHYWLKFIQQRLERTAPESAQKNINLEILRKLSVPVPPMELQKKFAAAVRHVEKSVCALNELSACAEALFGSLNRDFFRQ